MVTKIIFGKTKVVFYQSEAQLESYHAKNRSQLSTLRFYLEMCPAVYDIHQAAVLEALLVMNVVPPS